MGGAYDVGVSMAEADQAGTMRRGLALVAVGVAIALACVVVWRVLLDQPDAPAPSKALDRSQTAPQWLSCARQVIDGDVVAKRAGDPGRVKVTFTVGEWVKPVTGKETVTLDLPVPTSQGKKPWRVGSRYLVVVPRNSRLAPSAFTGSQIPRYRKIVDSNLPEAGATTCPKFWRNARAEDVVSPGAS